MEETINNASDQTQEPKDDKFQWKTEDVVNKAFKTIQSLQNIVASALSITPQNTPELSFLDMDMNLRISDDRTISLSKYLEEFNSDVEKVISIPEDDKSELRQCLTDYLKELEGKPLTAKEKVASQALICGVQMLASAYALSDSKKHTIKALVKIHESMKADKDNKNNNSSEKSKKRGRPKPTAKKSKVNKKK
jgi:hypothetical protein